MNKHKQNLVLFPVPAVSHLMLQLADGVLQRQDAAEQRALQRPLQAAQGGAQAPLLPLDQPVLEPVQSSQNLLALRRRH